MMMRDHTKCAFRGEYVGRVEMRGPPGVDSQRYRRLQWTKPKTVFPDELPKAFGFVVESQRGRREDVVL